MHVSQRKFSAAVIIFYILLVSLIATCLVSPISNYIPSCISAGVRYVFAQRWGFFTKSLDTQVELYRITDNQLRKEDIYAVGEKGLYGLSKQPRFIRSVLYSYTKKTPAVRINSQEDFSFFLLKHRADTVSLLQNIQEFRTREFVVILSKKGGKSSSLLFAYPFSVYKFYVPSKKI